MAKRWRGSRRAASAKGGARRDGRGNRLRLRGGSALELTLSFTQGLDQLALRVRSVAELSPQLFNLPLLDAQRLQCCTERNRIPGHRFHYCGPCRVPAEGIGLMLPAAG